MPAQIATGMSQEQWSTFIMQANEALLKQNNPSQNCCAQIFCDDSPGGQIETIMSRIVQEQTDKLKTQGLLISAKSSLKGCETTCGRTDSGRMHWLELRPVSASDDEPAERYWRVAEHCGANDMERP